MFISSIWSGIEFTDDVGLPVTVALVCAIVLIAAGVNLVPKMVHKWEIEYSTRDLTYGALCLSLSYSLSWLKIFEMPLGGSVTLAALAPAYIYCYYFGFRKGMVFSTAYMLLQFTQPVFICHPLSAFFDYMAPNFLLCTAGLFGFRSERYGAFVKKHRKESDTRVKQWGASLGGHYKLLFGVLLHTALRYGASVLSGVICWDYWGYGAAPFVYKLTFSLGYNAALIVDCAIAAGAVAIMLSSQMFNRYMTASFAARRAASLTAGTEGARNAAEDEQNFTNVNKNNIDISHK